MQATYIDLTSTEPWNHGECTGESPPNGPTCQVSDLEIQPKQGIGWFPYTNLTNHMETTSMEWFTGPYSTDFSCADWGIQARSVIVPVSHAWIAWPTRCLGFRLIWYQYLSSSGLTPDKETWPTRGHGFPKMVIIWYPPIFKLMILMVLWYYPGLILFYPTTSITILNGWLPSNWIQMAKWLHLDSKMVL